MAEGTTRRGFLQRVMVGVGTAAAAAAGLAPLASRADLWNQLVQHIVRTGYTVSHYVKW